MTAQDEAADRRDEFAALLETALRLEGLYRNASTGKLDWTFNTVSNRIGSTPYGSGGAWETPLAGRDGSVTFGTGNPYQSAAEAIARPSPWLYTDCEVNLDAATGELWGNFPQTYSMAGIINSAMRLSQSWEDRW